MTSRPRRPGIESTVRADLGKLGHLDEGVNPTLVAMAFNLARIIDSWSAQKEFTAAQLGALVKAHQQLAALMSKLAEVPNEADDFDERMGTPTMPATVRNPEVP